MFGDISEHITNIYQQGELMQSATVRKFRTVRKEGNRMVTRNMDYYNLDMIINPIKSRINIFPHSSDDKCRAILQ